MNDEEIELPEVGELVVATIKEVKRFGAYLELDDFGIIAYLPISEVSSKWVRNIFDVLKVGEKIVVKVLRVDYRNNTVDVSLKDVSPRERERVLRKWKKDQRGIQLISEMTENLGLNTEEVEEKFLPLIEKMPTIYDALERIVVDPIVLDELSFKEKKRDILDFLSKRVKPKKYVYEVRFKAFYVGKNGVNTLKESLKDIEEKIRKEANNIDLEIFNDGTPYYRIRIKSYRPETIKRRVIPFIKKLKKEYRDKINMEIKEERSHIEI